VHGFVGTALPLIRLLCRQPSQRGLESAISAPNTAGAVIYAKDLSRVTAFYREVAVLPVTHSEIDYAILESETFQRVVHAIPAGIAASIDVASPPMRREDAAVKLIFPVPSIDASRALAAMHGGALNPPEREPGRDEIPRRQSAGSGLCRCRPDRSENSQRLSRRGLDRRRQLRRHADRGHSGHRLFARVP